MNASGSGKSGFQFRGFASKLRDQAKDVVGNVKLPSFDDMAMNDDYIHSPDFNVRGKNRKEQQEETMSAQTSGGTSLNGTTIDEASNYSTESSWSLLDRSSRSNLVLGGKTAAATSSARIPERTTIEPQTTEVSSPSENDRQTATKPTVSLLSVVSDALQPTTPVQANRGDYSRDKMIQHVVDSDDYSDQSSEDFDEEDPILSILRKDSKNSIDTKDYKKNTNNSENAPASVITINKSSKNRFMDDVRLQAAPEGPGFEGIIKTNPTMPASSNTEANIFSGPLGGFFNKNTALQNFKRIVLRKDPNETQQQRSPPPLARERAKRAEQKDDFQIKASTSVGILGDDDLEQLNQLKLAGESSSALSSLSSIPMLVVYLGEHRHSLFVIFTLILAVFVYFRQSAASI